MRNILLSRETFNKVLTHKLYDNKISLRECFSMEFQTKVFMHQFLSMRRINDKFVKYTIRLTYIEEILASKWNLNYKVSTL